MKKFSGNRKIWQKYYIHFIIYLISVTTMMNLKSIFYRAAIYRYYETILQSVILYQLGEKILVLKNIYLFTHQKYNQSCDLIKFMSSEKT